MGPELNYVSGSFVIINPDVKFLIMRILKEYSTDDALSPLSIEATTLKLLDECSKVFPASQAPAWLKQLYELLNDQWAENFSLSDLADNLQVHPVTISRYFPLHFHCTLGEYIRKIRINRSISLLRHSKMSVTEIAYRCNFSDHSHFTRTFKSFTGLLPRNFRNI